LVSQESTLGERLELARVDRLRRMISEGGAPLDDLMGDMDSARALIRSGEARLRIVVQPWGVEFELVAAAPHQAASFVPRSPY